MEAVVLILVLYCGAPVSAALATPEGVKFWALDRQTGAAAIDLALRIEKDGGQVFRVKVEEQVEGVRCPVST